ncbi:DUF6197 family protein [Micromonospora eburnea]|uniref:Uncharacterized protein n=1 Tax=Micromonospora eburnea TaxID=227316 RepID=A0A1C6VNU8_9ACTN|nr:hypothetical protein [Micromonospora eburnea]SCL67917.1 hypothetical protein GA0070604_6140 [Micromonospora eburnea]
MTADLPRSPAQALRAAAAYLRRYDWHPGPGLYDPHNGCTHSKCRVVRSGMYPATIYGSLRVALLGRPAWFAITDPATAAAYAATVDHFAHHLGTRGAAGMRAAILPWEHAPGRTRQHVMTALLAAADTASTAPFPPVRLAPVIPLPVRPSETGRPRRIA